MAHFTSSQFAERLLSEATAPCWQHGQGISLSQGMGRSEINVDAIRLSRDQQYVEAFVYNGLFSTTFPVRCWTRQQSERSPALMLVTWRVDDLMAQV